jgi:hypothetical protein
MEPVALNLCDALPTAPVRGPSRQVRAFLLDLVTMTLTTV